MPPSEVPEAASVGPVPGTPIAFLDGMRSAQHGTTIQWRLRDAGGKEAHAVISPEGTQVAALWFILGDLQETRSFRTPHGAMRWLERKLVKLQLAGWSLFYAQPAGSAVRGGRPA